MPGDDPLFSTRWVHAYEEDSAVGAVYVPDGPDVPLSRRPREQVAFHQDGTAEWFTGAPDDRLVATPARWRHADDESPIAAGPTGVVITLIEQHEQRLVIRVERHGQA